LQLDVQERAAMNRGSRSLERLTESINQLNLDPVKEKIKSTVVVVAHRPDFSLVQASYHQNRALGLSSLILMTSDNMLKDLAVHGN
jgi:hypothetical protein